MTNSVSLYDSLYSEEDLSDVGMMTLNNLYNHLNFNEMSNYYTLNQYTNIFKKLDNSMLSIFHFNIRCLNTNFLQLEALLSGLNHAPDILALTETWLDKDNKTNYVLEGYRSVHVVRENRMRGGVSIFISSKHDFEMIEEYCFVTENLEICTVLINVNNTPYVIAAIYRPQDKLHKIKEFRKEFAPILKSALFKKSCTILLGDFNINLLQHSEHQQTNEFLNLMQTFNFIPLITRPTRFPEGEQSGDPSLLDHIYINFTPSITPGILHYHITDHLPVFANFALSQPVTSTHTLKFRIFNDANEQKFTRSLAHILWEEILIEENIDKNFDTFLNLFTKIYNDCFPIATKTISNKRFTKPWMSSGLLTSVKMKNHMFKNFKLGLTCEAEYKLYKNRLVHLLRVSKKQYYTKLFSSYRTNTKKLWQTINSLTNNFNNKPKINKIVLDNRIVTSPFDIAEVFNDFFVKIAPDLERNLPKSDTDPLIYLSDRNQIDMRDPHANATAVITAIKSLKTKNWNIDD